MFLECILYYFTDKPILRRNPPCSTVNNNQSSRFDDKGDQEGCFTQNTSSGFYKSGIQETSQPEENSTIVTLDNNPHSETEIPNTSSGGQVEEPQDSVDVDSFVRKVLGITPRAGNSGFHSSGQTVTTVSSVHHGLPSCTTNGTSKFICDPNVSRLSGQWYNIEFTVPGEMQLPCTWVLYHSAGVEKMEVSLPCKSTGNAVQNTQSMSYNEHPQFNKESLQQECPKQTNYSVSQATAIQETRLPEAHPLTVTTCSISYWTSGNLNAPSRGQVNIPQVPNGGQHLLMNPQKRLTNHEGHGYIGVTGQWYFWITDQLLCEQHRWHTSVWVWNIRWFYHECTRQSLACIACGTNNRQQNKVNISARWCIYTWFWPLRLDMSPFRHFIKSQFPHDLYFTLA